MESVDLPVLLDTEAQAPHYQTPDSAGMDLHSLQTVTLEPLQRTLVPTGLRMAIPRGYEGQIRPRSGLAAKYGISMVNTPGTIDSDYRGEIKVLLINLGQEAVTLEKGERIGQMVICPVVRANIQIVDELDDTQRGEGGFGSTGTK